MNRYLLIIVHRIAKFFKNNPISGVLGAYRFNFLNVSLVHASHWEGRDPGLFGSPYALYTHGSMFVNNAIKIRLPSTPHIVRVFQRFYVVPIL